MLGGHNHKLGPKLECTVPPPLISHFNHCAYVVEIPLIQLLSLNTLSRKHDVCISHGPVTIISRFIAP